MVYVTFDDGPAESTIELLDLLEELDVPATFFWVGAQMLKYPDAVRATHKRGHAIACHSFYHQTSLLKSKENFRRETERFNRVLGEVLGYPLEVRMIRFPYGSSTTTPEVRRYARESGYLWIDWNANNFDTHPDYSRNTQAMLAAAMRTSGDRDEIVMLMHEDKRRTREMLPALIQHYRDNGYVFDILTPDLDHYIPGVSMGLPIQREIRKDEE